MLNMHEKTGEFFYGTGYELLAHYAIFEKVFIRVKMNWMKASFLFVNPFNFCFNRLIVLIMQS